VTELETREDIGGKKKDAPVRYWLREIEAAKKREKGWRDRIKEIHKIYTGASDKDPFNILKSNTDTLRPAVYSQRPKPVARRRFLQKDPVAREASQIIEEALSFQMDAYNFDGLCEKLNLDFNLISRAVPVVRYKPYFEKVPTQSLDEAGMPVEVMEERKVYEEVTCDYLGPDDYLILGDGSGWDLARYSAMKGL